MTLPFKISELIRKRIQQDGAKYYCNDNISNFVSEEELDELVLEVAGQFEGVLRSLVIDIDNDHNTQDTAKRVAKMFIWEVFNGRYVQAPRVTAFPNAAK